jgi:hypothetical protein
MVYYRTYLNRFAVSKIHRRLISAGNSFPNLCEPSSCTGSESFQAVPKGVLFCFFFFFARARHSGFRTVRGGCQSLLLQLECECLLSTVTAAANELTFIQIDVKYNPTAAPAKPNHHAPPSLRG